MCLRCVPSGFLIVPAFRALVPFVVPNIYHEEHESHEHQSANEPDAHPC